MKSYRSILLAACLIISLFSVEVAAQNLLMNPGVEGPVEAETGLPKGWPILLGATTVWGTNVMYSDNAFEGSQSILIRDTKNTEGHGLRSAFYPVKPGETYLASAHIMGLGYVYIEFWNEAGERIHTKASINRNRNEFVYTEVSETVPEGAVHATVLFFTGVSHVTDTYFDAASLTKL